MGNKKIVMGVLMVLLVVGIGGVLAAAPVASGAHSMMPPGAAGRPGAFSPFGQEPTAMGVPGDAHSHLPGRQAPALVVPGWQQVNSNGFGDQQAGEVTTVEAFNGYLYAGTHNPTNEARIFRSADGVTWTPVTEPGFGISHDIAPWAILDMAIFNNYLYAGTGRRNASQLWRTQNGLIWAPMDVTGFSDPDNVDITALAEYGGKIYAGVTNRTSGAQIWSSFTGDNNSWSQVAPDAPGTIAASVTAFSVFSDTLYAAIEFEADSPVQIWRSSGGAWETIVGDGFGDSNTMMTGGMAVFGNYLYAGAGNTADGAQLWRTNDGATWSQASTPASGDANNQKIDMVFVFQDHLYISTHNGSTGIEVWRTADGALWEKVNQDGFGDSHNSGSNWSNATADFLGQFYVGTSNSVDGGELWRMQQPFGVNLSPDATMAGAAGQSITYSLWITNTGIMADSFDLAITGQTWTTTLSASQVNLAPAASTAFTATITIPAGALGNDADTATITATSQGDAAKSDMAHLTTTVLPVYGLTLSPNQAKWGAAGQTVIYTLWITNTGNVADTFNLEPSGNLWNTQISPANLGLAAGVMGSVQVHVSIPAGALGNASDNTTITATSSGNPLANDSVQLATTVTPFYGLALSPGSSLSAAPGKTVTYTLSITNTGNVADIFDLAPSGNNWATTLSNASLMLAAQASTTFTVMVDIPPGTADQATDTVTITATSQADGSKSDSAVLTTTSVSTPVYGVALSAGASLPGPAGGWATYTLTITNTGNVVDIFDLAPSGNIWAVTLSKASVMLAAQASTTFTVTMDIPPGAAGNDSDSVTITATSLGDGSKSDTALLTTSVLPAYGVHLSPDAGLSGAAGATVMYTVAITNTGNVVDVFDLAPSGNIWAVTLSKASVMLAAQASTTFTVTVDIPPGAAGNDSDSVTITATSLGDGSKSDSAVLTTVSTGSLSKVYLPIVMRPLP